MAGLKAGASFQFQVRAVNYVGLSRWSPASTLTSTKATTPLKPKPVVLHHQTTTSLQIKWELPDDRGSRIDEVRHVPDRWQRKTRHTRCRGRRVLRQ